MFLYLLMGYLSLKAMSREDFALLEVELV